MAGSHAQRMFQASSGMRSSAAGRAGRTTNSRTGSMLKGIFDRGEQGPDRGEQGSTSSLREGKRKPRTERGRSVHQVFDAQGVEQTQGGRLDFGDGHFLQTITH